LAPGGSLQSVGWAAGREAVLPVGSTLGSPAPKAIVSVYNGAGLTDRPAQLRRLLDLVAAGRLRVPVGWRGPWEKIADAVDALGNRRLRGKAVLDVE
jgi:NADPH:quinone reductase-like Zn-dependent oxidoreductase